MNKKMNELKWNLINAGLAGVLVLLGALASGDVNVRSLGAAVIAAAIVSVNLFKNYWNKLGNTGGLRLI